MGLIEIILVIVLIFLILKEVNSTSSSSIQKNVSDVDSVQPSQGVPTTQQVNEPVQQAPSQDEPQSISCEGAWSPSWSACSETCGGGTQYKSYTITVPAANGGRECPHIDGDVVVQRCNEQPCATHCEGHWSPSWSPCNETCGGGTQFKSYTITVPAANGGRECPHAEGDTMTQPCNEQPCPPVPCVGEWTPWSPPCPEVSCNTDPRTEQQRVYHISRQSQYGGDACPFEEGDIQTRRCGIKYCNHYWPYPLSVIGMMSQMGSPKNGITSKEECATACGQNPHCQSYVYCNDHPHKNAGMIYGPNGVGIYGSCLHFSRTLGSFQVKGYTPTMRELLRMNSTELRNIEQSTVDGCGIYFMNGREGIDITKDCEGDFVPVGGCNQVCDGTQSPNSGEQTLQFKVTQPQEHGGAGCINDYYHNMTITVPCQAC